MTNQNDMEKLMDILIIALAVIAAVVASGLIAGFSMWPFIVAYWLTLTVKSILDYAKKAGAGNAKKDARK